MNNLTLTQSKLIIKNDNILRLNHFSHIQFQRVFTPSVQNKDLYNSLKIFGIQSNDNKISETSLKILDNALANKRPDLDIAIWNEISKILEKFNNGPSNRNLNNTQIPQLSYDILKDTGLKIGVVILLSLIAQIVHGGAEKMAFTGLDGKTKLTISIVNFDFKNCIYIREFELSDGIKWLSSTMELTSIPNTLASDLSGKPLKSVISHPVFDRYPIEIEKSYSNEKITYLDTNYLIAKDEQISLEELAIAELTRLRAI